MQLCAGHACERDRAKQNGCYHQPTADRWRQCRHLCTAAWLCGECCYCECCCFCCCCCCCSCCSCLCFGPFAKCKLFGALAMRFGLGVSSSARPDPARPGTATVCRSASTSPSPPLLVGAHFRAVHRTVEQFFTRAQNAALPIFTLRCRAAPSPATSPTPLATSLHHSPSLALTKVHFA